MRYVVPAILLTMVAILSGCSSDKVEVAPTAAPTQDPFDPNLLNAIALQPEDVGGRAQSFAGFAFAETPSYSVTYGDVAFQIQSTVLRVTDAISKEQQFSGFRGFFASYGRNERTLSLPGVDQAFAYQSFEINQPRQAAIVLTGDFIAVVDVHADAEARAVDVHAVNVEELITTVLARIDQARLLPPAVTPIPGAPTFPVSD